MTDVDGSNITCEDCSCSPAVMLALLVDFELCNISSVSDDCSTAGEMLTFQRPLLSDSAFSSIIASRKKGLMLFVAIKSGEILGTVPSRDVSQGLVLWVFSQSNSPLRLRSMRRWIELRARALIVGGLLGLLAHVSERQDCSVREEDGKNEIESSACSAIWAIREWKGRPRRTATFLNIPDSQLWKEQESSKDPPKVWYKWTLTIFGNERRSAEKSMTNSFVSSQMRCCGYHPIGLMYINVRQVLEGETVGQVGVRDLKNAECNTDEDDWHTIWFPHPPKWLAIFLPVFVSPFNFLDLTGVLQLWLFDNHANCRNLQCFDGQFRPHLSCISVFCAINLFEALTDDVILENWCARIKRR